MEQDKGIEDPEFPEQRDVNAAPNVPGLILPTRKSNRHAEAVLVMAQAIKTRMNKGAKK
jgi:hypothetical protein